MLEALSLFLLSQAAPTGFWQLATQDPGPPQPEGMWERSSWFLPGDRGWGLCPCSSDHCLRLRCLWNLNLGATVTFQTLGHKATEDQSCHFYLLGLVSSVFPDLGSQHAVSVTSGTYLPDFVRHTWVPDSLSLLSHWSWPWKLGSGQGRGDGCLVSTEKCPLPSGSQLGWPKQDAVGWTGKGPSAVAAGPSSPPVPTVGHFWFLPSSGSPPSLEPILPGRWDLNLLSPIKHQSHSLPTPALRPKILPCSQEPVPTLGPVSNAWDPICSEPMPRQSGKALSPPLPGWALTRIVANQLVLF